MVFASPRTGSKSSALLVVPLFMALALSGCLGDDDETLGTGAALSDCAAGVGVLEIRILPGAGMPDSTAWYDPAEPDLTGIHTICWVNDDTMPHVILAMPDKVETLPAWVIAATTGGDAGGHGGHGGHDDGGHGGAGHSGPLAFNVSFGPGERLAMPLTTDYRALSVHCHPHPWMVAEWRFVPAADVAYATEIGHLLYRGSGGADTKAGESAEASFDVMTPNLRLVRATVDWDDAVDDEQGLGTTLNKSDTLLVELKDPSGEVVATKQETNRKGTIVVEYDMPIAWPETVTARGLAAAAERLAMDVPDDTSGSGAWTVTVKVVSGNGPTTLDGDKQSVIDGHQEWVLTFETVHEYARVLPEGRTHLVLANPSAVLAYE